MRKLILQAILLMVCLYTKATTTPMRDTIVHAIDGNINEWKTDSFETDKDTQIQYAADHDGSYLFLAVKIADPRVQMQIMMRGMNMYIDRKGKHRQNTGINFPLQQDMEAMRAGFSGNRDTKTAPDPIAMRESLSKNMLLLKTFGFDGMEDKTQLIVNEGGINLSYDWDGANTMYIEYLVPLSFLGKNSDLNGKPLSIGWQMNSAPAAPARMPVATSSRIVAVPSSGGGRGRSADLAPAPSSSASIPTTSSQSSEHIFWTKHVLSF